MNNTFRFIMYLVAGCYLTSLIAVSPFFGIATTLVYGAFFYKFSQIKK